MNIFILKDISILSSGERSFHVAPYRNLEDAKNDLTKKSKNI